MAMAVARSGPGGSWPGREGREAAPLRERGWAAERKLADGGALR